jgi:hypothetical protein
VKTLARWLVPVIAIGCGSAADGAGACPADAATPSACPSDLPSSCPTPVPSYRADIVPVLETSCLYCHNPKGFAGHSEATYADVYAQRSAILDQVYGCMMPPATSCTSGSSFAPLSRGEREALLGWLVCGAPDN